MGMYDSINIEMDCPNCGNKYVAFQSKEGDCLLDRIEPEEVENFGSFCSNCGADISFSRLSKDIEERLPNSSLVKNSWRFGKYLYRCRVSYTVKCNPKALKTRKPSIIREIEDKILKKK